MRTPPLLPSGPAVGRRTQVIHMLSSHAFLFPALSPAASRQPPAPLVLGRFSGSLDKPLELVLTLAVMLFRRFTARGEMRGRGERQLKRGEGERVHLYRYARDDDKLPRHLQCAMAVSKKNILGYTLVALTSYHQPSHAFVSRYPTCATANHQRRRGEAVLVSGGSKIALEQLRATPSSDSAALFSAKETQRAEIMEALFGATYDERIEKGRAAQGFLTTDALATRTLVPPRELTYGEYELDFFLSLVSECLSLRIGGDGTGSVSALESEAR